MGHDKRLGIRSTSIQKEGKKEGLTPLKTEELPTAAERRSAFREADHRRHRHVPSKKKKRPNGLNGVAMWH
jgi:hypothetical protein